MKKLIILTLLAAPAAALAQAERPDLAGLPGLSEMKQEAAAPEAGETLEPVQRPDSGRIMGEVSSALRLSSKQEERISSAINKKAAEFDKLMKDYEKSSAEERKWRYKMNDSRHAMEKIHRDLPDTVREYLDDEQRQEFDAIVAEKNKPAPRPEAPAVEQAAQPAPGEVAKPAKKKRMLRRKKVQQPAAGAPAEGAAPEASAPAGQAGAVAPAEDEAGQVMVDKEPAAAQPQAKKRRLKRKVQAAPGTQAPVTPAAQPAGPAGAQPTGKEAAADEDGASYP
jgi:hypothetical protein